MIKLIISVVIVLGVSLALILGVGAYLAPNDLAKCDNRPTTGDCEPADAIIAVSGGDTKSRTAKAINLYQNGWANKLIFSGAALDENSPSNASAMRDQAIAAGIPEANIAIDELAQDTQENATNVSALTAQKNYERLIVVTSGYHQRRTGIEFAQAFPNAEIINSPVKNDKQWSSIWWLTPQGWWLAIGEIIKITFTLIRN